MDEFQLRDELRAKRREIKSFDELAEFLKYIKENCNCGYGEAPRAIAQASLAVAWWFASEFGITGFQAGCVMWDFLQDWEFSDNKCGLRILDYDNMLYPQYDHKFEKTISRSTWQALQKEAEKNLKDKDFVPPDVIAHWQSIVNGKVPFGYVVKEE